MQDNIKINLGFADGLPVYCNPNASVNKSIALIGKSGSGKSAQAQRIICEIVESGGTVVVISHHGTFEGDQLLPYYKGIINEYRSDIDVYETGISLPLFMPVTFSDGTIEHTMDTVGAITDMISRALLLGGAQREILRAAIYEVMYLGTYQECGFKAIGDALGGGVSKNNKKNELFGRLEFLFRHNIFVEGDDFIKKGAINVVNLDKLDLISQEIISELLLAYIWRRGIAGQFKDSKSIYLFLDECQNFFTSKKAPLVLMLSEGRKLGINLILATQMLLEGANSLRMSITQCDLILFFKPSADRMRSTARLISSTDVSICEAKVRGLKKGHFIATGDFLLGNRQVDYPMIVTANVGEIAALDKEYKLF